MQQRREIGIKCDSNPFRRVFEKEEIQRCHQNGAQKNIEV